jgi:predicted enzyme related to lactoylglutathione lyase
MESRFGLVTLASTLSSPRLNLLVLRVSDLDRSAVFYRLLGLSFTRHAHGSGPEHLASEAHGFVFELYPATPEQPPSVSARIGFAVADVDALATALGGVEGARVVSPPKDSPWGRRAVVADPDGHRVELVNAAAGGTI